MLTIYREPKVSLLSRPQFLEPAHLPVKWVEPGTDGEKLTEFAGRLCYMSQHNPAGRTSAEYHAHILDSGHGSVLEHANYSVLFEGVSRSLTHEWIRHRAGWAYSQLSQRFVDESDAAFVMPPAIIGDAEAEESWEQAMAFALDKYADLVHHLMDKYSDMTDKTLRRKRAREAARGALPNSTETKIVATGNVRAWRTVLEMRGSVAADQEIRRLACAVTQLLKAEAPIFFQDLEIVDGCVQVKHSKV